MLTVLQLQLPTSKITKICFTVCIHLDNIIPLPSIILLIICNLHVFSPIQSKKLEIAQYFIELIFQNFNCFNLPLKLNCVNNKMAPRGAVQKRGKKEKVRIPITHHPTYHFQDPNAPKRPQTAYFLWLRDNRPRLTKPGMSVTDVAKGWTYNFTIVCFL